MVMSLLPPWNSGMYSVTLSFSRNLPSSNSFMSDGVVATTLVSEAQSKIVSSGHRFGLGNDRPVAVGLAVNHLSIVPDDQDRARQPSLLDGVVYGRIEGGAGRKGLRAHCGHSEGRAPEKLHIVL